MCVTSENPILERKETLTVCQNCKGNRIPDESAGPLCCFCVARHVENAGILLELRRNLCIMELGATRSAWSEVDIGNPCQKIMTFLYHKVVQSKQEYFASAICRR